MVTRFAHTRRLFVGIKSYYCFTGYSTISKPHRNGDEGGWWGGYDMNIPLLDLV